MKRTRTAKKTNLPLSCECGKVKGIARDVSPSLGNRIICYCASCRAFPEKLGKADRVLDEYGGTDIYQLPSAHLEITEGREHLRCLKHTEKGLHRWYAGCCNTPIANGRGLGLPLVGLIHTADAEPGERDARLGKVRAHVFVNEATKPLPRGRKGGITMVTLRLVGQLLRWHVQGKGRPHPFFSEDGEPFAKPEIR